MIHPNIDTTIYLIIHARTPVLSLATSTLATTRMRPATGVRVGPVVQFWASEVILLLPVLSHLLQGLTLLLGSISSFHFRPYFFSCYLTSC
jgi:hypothetical protein